MRTTKQEIRQCIVNMTLTVKSFKQIGELERLCKGLLKYVELQILIPANIHHGDRNLTYRLRHQ